MVDSVILLLYSLITINKRKGHDMAISRLERELKSWELELKIDPKATEITPAKVRTLKGKIDKLYAAHSRLARMEEKALEYILEDWEK